MVVSPSATALAPCTLSNDLSHVWALPDRLCPNQGTTPIMGAAVDAKIQLKRRMHAVTSHDSCRHQQQCRQRRRISSCRRCNVTRLITSSVATY